MRLINMQVVPGATGQTNEFQLKLEFMGKQEFDPDLRDWQLDRIQEFAKHCLDMYYEPCPVNPGDPDLTYNWSEGAVIQNQSLNYNLDRDISTYEVTFEV